MIASAATMVALAHLLMCNKCLSSDFIVMNPLSKVMASEAGSRRSIPTVQTESAAARNAYALRASGELRTAAYSEKMNGTIKQTRTSSKAGERTNVGTRRI
jgi:hypothetical protein